MATKRKTVKLKPKDVLMALLTNKSEYRSLGSSDKRTNFRAINKILSLAYPAEACAMATVMGFEEYLLDCWHDKLCDESVSKNSYKLRWINTPQYFNEGDREINDFFRTNKKAIDYIKSNDGLDNEAIIFLYRQRPEIIRTLIEIYGDVRKN